MPGVGNFRISFTPWGKPGPHESGPLDLVQKSSRPTIPVSVMRLDEDSRTSSCFALRLSEELERTYNSRK